MRGSPEPLTRRYPARLIKKRFPHRFLPSSRNFVSCTLRSNVRRANFSLWKLEVTNCPSGGYRFPIPRRVVSDDPPLPTFSYPIG
jgi:hypothetical protein